MAEIDKLNPLVAFFDFAVVIGGIEPRDAKSVVRSQQSLDITTYRMFWAEPFDAFGSAITIQLVGIGRNIPGSRRHFQKLPIPSEWVEHTHVTCGWCHQ